MGKESSFQSEHGEKGLGTDVEGLAFPRLRTQVMLEQVPAGKT